MKKNIYKKSFVLVIIILFAGTNIVQSTCGDLKNIYKNASYTTILGDNETEYWALIFAVGIYKNNPWENRPSMLVSANNLYEVLLNSSQWQADHIHKVTGSEATGRRLIKELIWLIQNEDIDDMSLIYLASHGSPLKGPKGNPVDIRPKDEDDGADEILIMYEGFDKWYAFIWDDLLNFFLSLLQSKGTCLIVESCYSGGFNDGLFPKGFIPNTYTAKSFTQGLVKELATPSRIILMSCEENEPCYGSYFSEYLIEGFWGLADFLGNNDGVNSAEEGFDYAKFKVNVKCDFTPTILDLYPGEFPITLSKK